MSLWEIFVLGQVRLCLNTSYDELHYRANYDTLLRGMLGVLPTDYSVGTQYEYQNIYDNVSLLDEPLLGALNDVIVEVGHQVFKKKEAAGLHLKLDRVVVETDVHFPTDYNLLWDSARKCIECAEALDIPGWRKHTHWKRRLKGFMRAVGKASRGAGKGKAQRVEKAARAYLKKAKALEKKVDAALSVGSLAAVEERARGEKLRYYHQMLAKHIDLTERRLLKGEKIPHGEKVFSIFQPWSEFIIKGKRHPWVEIGKNLAVTTDQYHLIVDWQIMDQQTDNQLTVPVARRLAGKYPIASLSVERGFSDMTDKKKLQQFIPQVVMPKKGRRTKQQKAIESVPGFRKRKNKHNAIESNINELSRRGLNRCSNRTEAGFSRYVGMAVAAYNLHKIGRHLLAGRTEAVRHLEAA